MDFKNIDIGSLIQRRIAECKIEMPRICNFFKLSEKEVEAMYRSKDMNIDALLKWSKLLEYDFFRLYSHHLILYAPQGSMGYSKVNVNASSLPQFRKNIYTKEVITFILELIERGEKTKGQIIEEYKIPKSTLYKWIDKHTEIENRLNV